MIQLMTEVTENTMPWLWHPWVDQQHTLSPRWQSQSSSSEAGEQVIATAAISR
jgi:hypothetical protein